MSRKVLKCFRSHSCPVLVHCSGGIDRTGTYILIDMVLSKMSRGNFYVLILPSFCVRVYFVDFS